MKIITKKVYYCDYCNKHSLRPLTKHEERCTLNPNRVCGFCGSQLDLMQIVKKLRDKIKTDETYQFIELSDIYDEIDYDCPGCTLALIRLLNAEYKHEFSITLNDFDYNKARLQWWEDHNLNVNNC